MHTAASVDGVDEDGGPRCPARAYGGFTTTYVTASPANWGSYQVLPHCWYARPFTTTDVQDGGSEYATEPITAAVVATAAAVASGCHPWS